MPNSNYPYLPDHGFFPMVATHLLIQKSRIQIIPTHFDDFDMIEEE